MPRHLTGSGRFCRPASGFLETVCRVVNSASEYREHADECFDWARTARSERERLIFIQMAKTWLRAAFIAEMSQNKRHLSKVDDE
jgi:hypothetical protein